MNWTSFVKSAIGDMTIEEYRDEIAISNGYEDYEDMYESGERIGNGLDIEEDEDEMLATHLREAYDDFIDRQIDEMIEEGLFDYD